MKFRHFLSMAERLKSDLGSELVKLGKIGGERCAKRDVNEES